jgi:hypothetical protein
MERNLKRSSRSLSAIKNQKTRNKGAILFLAVSAIAVLSILALGTTSSVMQELRLAKFLTDANTSAVTASSIVELIKVLFPVSPGQAPMTLTLYDLRPRTILLGEKNIEVSFSCEENKINISLAPHDIIQRLPGLANGGPLLDRIANAHVKFKEELLLIDGMTTEIYDGIKNLVTTYGAGGVNINTASADELALLGMDADLIKKIHDYRSGEDGIEGTKDDKSFMDKGTIPTALQPFFPSSLQLTLLNNLIAANQLTTATEYLDLFVVVKKGAGKLRAYKIILDLTNGAVVSWVEE